MSQGGLERERLLSRLEQVKQQTGNLEARAEEAGRESSELQAQLATLEQQTAERTQQVEKLQQEFAAAKDTLAQVVMRQEDLNFQLGAAEQEVETCRQSLMAVVSHGGGAAQSACASRRGGPGGGAPGGAHRRGKGSQRSGAFPAGGGAGGLPFGASARCQHAGGAGGIRLANHPRPGAGAQRRGLPALQVEALRREYSGSMARKEALEQSLARHAYSTESVRRLLSGEIPANGHTFQPMGLLADFVEVSPGYEEVVEEFLKQELECVVVEQHDAGAIGNCPVAKPGHGTLHIFRHPSAFQRARHGGE